MSLTKIILISAAFVRLVGVENCKGEISTDLWDVSQGSVVTASSDALDWGGFFVSDVRSIFGYENIGKVEPTETIFGDHAKGFVHWVEWETPSPITLRSFKLNAGHDDLNGRRDANARGFSRFTLFAESMDTGLFDTILFELFPANPYGDTVAPGNSMFEFKSINDFRLLANVLPTQASRFRAEFVQYGDSISSALGPRIRELDGFDTFFLFPSLPAFFSPPSPGCLAWVVRIAVEIEPQRHNGYDEKVGRNKPF